MATPGPQSAPSPADPGLDETDVDPAPDPAGALDIIRDQRRAVRDRAEPDSRILFLRWGGAWLLGNLVLFATARVAADHTPAGWSFAVYFTLLAVAVAVTIVHVVRRSVGVVGPSGKSGAMFGWSWTIGFVGVYLVMSGLDRAGADPEIINLGWSSLSCLLVGLLYLAGGAMWQSDVLYGLGAWLVLTGGAATLAGLPGSFLVMALAGGGGMLLGGLVTHLRDYRDAR